MEKFFDPSTDTRYGLLEIKCPFSKRGETLDEAASDPNFYLEKIGEIFTSKENTNADIISKYRDSWLLSV